MLTVSEISAQIGRGEIAWPGELRGDGLLLRLGSPLQPLANPGQVIDLASQDSIDTLYPSPLDDWDAFELAPGRSFRHQVRPRKKSCRADDLPPPKRKVTVKKAQCKLIASGEFLQVRRCLGGQGQDRTVDLPLFRRTLVPTELPDLGDEAQG